MGKKSRRRRTASQNSASRKEEQEQVITISELDDGPAACRWMSKGRVDTKGFAKYLPHTTQALQEGKVTPEEVAEDVEDAFTFFKTQIVGHRDEEDDFVVGLAGVCAKTALPRAFFQSERQKDEITAAFSEDLVRKLAEAHRDPDKPELPLNQCVDEICKKWADRLDRELFQSRKGTFLKGCPLYGISIEEYNNGIDPILRLCERQSKRTQVIEMRQESILTAAKNVANGLHDISHKCWECRKLCQDLKICAQCEVAQYCCKECQRSAWKQGHNHKCELLKLKSARLEDSLKVMDEYHSLGNENIFAKNGFALCHEVDFESLLLGFRIGCLVTREEGNIPSMRLYYQNLERVVRGEFWLLPNATEECFHEDRVSIEDEGELFFLLCCSLSFDYNENIRKICEAFAGGVEMPASIFIENYNLARKRMTQEPTDPTDRFRMRREYKRKILQLFMEKHHTRTASYFGGRNDDFDRDDEDEESDESYKGNDFGDN